MLAPHIYPIAQNKGYGTEEEVASAVLGFMGRQLSVNTSCGAEM